MLISTLCALYQPLLEVRLLGFRERTRLSVYLICDLNCKSMWCYSNQLAVKCLQILIGLRKFFFLVKRLTYKLVWVMGEWTVVGLLMTLRLAVPIVR